MQKILEAINLEIISLTRAIASERRNPGMDPDFSDDKLRDYTNRVAILRRIRTEIEDAYI